MHSPGRSIATGAAVSQEVFLAASPNGVKMWAGWDDGIGRGSADAAVVRLGPLQSGLVVAVACDLFDEVDDAPPQLRLLDAHEGLGQR
jgi:hypothetical protein